jgi:streptogramin lyase
MFGTMVVAAVVGLTFPFACGSQDSGGGPEPRVAVPAAPSLGFPAGLALAPDGSITVADRRANQVLRLDIETGGLRVLAGTGAEGFSGDGGAALDARLQNPDWVAYTPGGDLLIADTRNHRIRRVDARTGRISTIAGTGDNLSAGDGGPARAASLTNPYGVMSDPNGAIYVFDTEAHSIRRIDAATGVIRTVVGTGEAGFGGDGGPGTEAMLTRPHNGIVDARGRVTFGDSFNHRIRRWDPATGLVETLGGTGAEGWSPAGTPAGEARFTYFGGLLEEPDGSLVYTGLEGRIMRLRATDGIVDGASLLEHIAGAGEEGSGGDGGPASEATMRIPYGIVRLPSGDLVFSDAVIVAIRRIDFRTGVIRSLAPAGH